MPSTFTTNSRYVLLTYSQADTLDYWKIVELVGSLGGECIIGREHHVDGGIHFHAFVDFGRKFRSRRADVFDVDGCHPNITKSYGNAAGGFDYATKDGDVVAGGLARPGDGEDQAMQGSDTWYQAMQAETRDEFFALLEQCAPKNLILNFPAISRFADWRFEKKADTYSTPEGNFDLSGCPGLNSWVENNLLRANRGKPLFFYCVWGGKPPLNPPFIHPLLVLRQL